MNRKRVILATLLGVLSACVIYAYLATPRLEKAPPRSANQRVQRSVKVAETPESKKVQGRIDFAFLSAEPQEFSRAKRDIFRFGGRPPVKTAPKPIAPVAITSPVAAFKPVMPVVVEKALSRFTFLGFLEKDGEKTVFLSSSGNLFLVKRGESFGIDQEFLVADIDDDLLKVRHAGREGLIEIQLIEQQKLNASVSAPAQIRPAAKAPNQPRTRAFTPKRRVARPAAPPETEESFPGTEESFPGTEESVPETIEKNEPADEQKSKRLPTGLILEGDVNGTNQ